jgi:excinuclease UvrABC nuclease subunit
MRPCLYYDLDQCLAPCSVKHCTPEEYREAVDAAMDFLEGLQESLVERLEGEMEEAASALQFERAARLRDLRAAVLRWMERQNFMAAWEEPSGTLHLFCVRCAQLAGHCAFPSGSLNAGDPSWRLAALNTLRTTYSPSLEASSLLGPVAIEELNIMEGWLARKNARKTFVVPPQTPEDGSALERMLAQVESWVGGSSSEAPPLREVEIGR